MCEKTVSNNSDTLTTSLAENIPIDQGYQQPTRFQPKDKLNLQDLLDQHIPISALVLGVSYAILIIIIFPFQDVIIVEI